jgi:hypothetical protein
MPPRYRRSMNLDDLRKLELTSQPGTDAIPDDEPVSAIVKVREPNYVPSGVTVRSRIDETMFTTSCRAGQLRALESDPRVESVALAKRLPNVD